MHLKNNAGSFANEKMYLVAHSTDRYHVPSCMVDFRLYSRALTEEQIQELFNLRG